MRSRGRSIPTRVIDSQVPEAVVEVPKRVADLCEARMSFGHSANAVKCASFSSRWSEESRQVTAATF